MEQTWVLLSFLQDKSSGSRRANSPGSNARWVSSLLGDSLAPELPRLPPNTSLPHPTPTPALGGRTQILLPDLLGTLRWLTIAGVTPVPCTAPHSADKSANPAVSHLCPQQGQAAVKPFLAHEMEEAMRVSQVLFVLRSKLAYLDFHCATKSLQ